MRYKDKLDRMSREDLSREIEKNARYAFIAFVILAIALFGVAVSLLVPLVMSLGAH